MRSLGMIWIVIHDWSRLMKDSNESTALDKDSSIPLMHPDPSDFGKS